MHLRTFAVSAVVALALGAAGCGDDDESSGSQAASTTEATTSTGSQEATAQAIKDVKPRSTKANVAGGDAPIEQFVQTAANDAVAYWNKVFTNSNIPYAKPAVKVLGQGESGCASQFDPSQKPFFYCADKAGGELDYGAPALDQIRTSNGDGAVAFLSGFGAALDANEQLSGNPISGGQQVDDEFFRVSACFTGAWIRNVADRSILEAGDDAEILDTAGKFLGGDGEVGKTAVALGFNKGAGACQGGSSSSDSSAPDDSSQPSPSPSE